MRTADEALAARSSAASRVRTCSAERVPWDRGRGRGGVRPAHGGGVRTNADQAGRTFRQATWVARRTSSTASTSSQVGHRTAGRRLRGSRYSTRRARSSSTSPRSSKAEKANQYLFACATESSSTTGRPSTSTTSSTRSVDEEPEAEAVRERRLRRDRPQANLEARQAHLPARPLRGRRHAMEAFAQYFQGVVPKGYQPNAFGKVPTAVHRDRPVQGQELYPGARERAREERELLALGPAVLRPGAHHQLPVRRGQGNALLSGQIEAMADVPFAQVPVVRGQK